MYPVYVIELCVKIFIDRIKECEDVFVLLE
jgi:hypothetical protein